MKTNLEGSEEHMFVDRRGVPVRFDHVFADEPGFKPRVIFAKAGGGMSRHSEGDFNTYLNKPSECEAAN